MKISVIIPTYKREEVLCQTIESVIDGINKSNFATESELIIVDQTKEHSTRTTLFLNNLKGKIKYIYEEKPNLPNARNIGIRNSTGEIVVFLDDDIILHDGFFDNVIECYKSQGVKSVVGVPILKNMTGENILLNNQSPLKRIIQQALKKIICLKKFSVITPIGLLFSDRDHSKAGYADAGQGCCMSFRRDIFDIIGCFDTNYEGNALREETDFFCRLKKNKFKCYFSPVVALDHLMENTGGCRNDFDDKYWQTYFNNQFYFYKKNFGFKKWYISLLLLFDIITIIKNGMNYRDVIDNSYSRAVTLMSE